MQWLDHINKYVLVHMCTCIYLTLYVWDLKEILPNQGCFKPFSSCNGM